jgi:hypothetical protein
MKNKIELKKKTSKKCLLLSNLNGSALIKKYHNAVLQGAFPKELSCFLK